MSHPEGYSLAKLPPDATLVVEQWMVNVGAGQWTFGGETISESTIVTIAEMTGNRLSDNAPMAVVLVWPVEFTDRLIERLQEARDIGMPMKEIEDES